MGIESPDYSLDNPKKRKSGPEVGNSESLDGNLETGRSIEGSSQWARRAEIVLQKVAAIRESEQKAKQNASDPDNDLAQELKNA